MFFSSSSGGMDHDFFGGNDPFEGFFTDFGRSAQGRTGARTGAHSHNPFQGFGMFGGLGDIFDMFFEGQIPGRARQTRQAQTEEMDEDIDEDQGENYGGDTHPMGLGRAGRMHFHNRMYF